MRRVWLVVFCGLVGLTGCGKRSGEYYENEYPLPRLGEWYVVNTHCGRAEMDVDLAYRRNPTSPAPAIAVWHASLYPANGNVALALHNARLAAEQNGTVAVATFTTIKDGPVDPLTQIPVKMVIAQAKESVMRLRGGAN